MFYAAGIVMKGLFCPDNVVVRFFVKLGYCWWLNTLWLVTSLPVFTIGASTTALCYAMMKLHRGEGYPTRNFFHSFRENFGQATVLWLLYLAVGVLLALDLVYWNRRGGGRANLPWAVSFALCILYGISLSYVFAIQAKFVNPVRKTILYSILLPYRSLKETILMAVIIGSVLYFNLTTVFAVNFFTISIGIGLIAYVFAVYYINIFRKYIPEERDLDEVRLFRQVPAQDVSVSDREKEQALEELGQDLDRMNISPRDPEGPKQDETVY